MDEIGRFHPCKGVFTVAHSLGTAHTYDSHLERHEQFRRVGEASQKAHIPAPCLCQVTSFLWASVFSPVKLTISVPISLGYSDDVGFENHETLKGIRQRSTLIFLSSVLGTEWVLRNVVFLAVFLISTSLPPFLSLEKNWKWSLDHPDSLRPQLPLFRG